MHTRRAKVCPSSEELESTVFAQERHMYNNLHIAYYILSAMQSVQHKMLTSVAITRAKACIN